MCNKLQLTEVFQVPEKIDSWIGTLWADMDWWRIRENVLNAEWQKYKNGGSRKRNKYVLVLSYSIIVDNTLDNSGMCALFSYISYSKINIMQWKYHCSVMFKVKFFIVFFRFTKYASHYLFPCVYAIIAKTGSLYFYTYQQIRSQRFLWLKRGYSDQYLKFS